MHYIDDITMGNDIARNVHCKIIMGKAVARDIHDGITMSNDIAVCTYDITMYVIFFILQNV